jgi:hypothetical protein
MTQTCEILETSQVLTTYQEEVVAGGALLWEREK